MTTLETSVSFPELFQQLLTHQDSLNTSIHPEWKSQNWNFSLAIQAEYGELLTRLEPHWKWWGTGQGKSIEEFSPEERFQMVLELIDILHFQVSDDLIICAVFGREVKMPTYFANAELLIAEIADVSYSWTFSVLKKYFHYSFEETCYLYFLKNALNQFRQERKLREGSYEKVWADGREDNVHLMEIWEGNSADNNPFNLTPKEFIIWAKLCLHTTWLDLQGITFAGTPDFS